MKRDLEGDVSISIFIDLVEDLADVVQLVVLQHLRALHTEFKCYYMYTHEQYLEQPQKKNG